MLSDERAIFKKSDKEGGRDLDAENVNSDEYFYVNITQMKQKLQENSNKEKSLILQCTQSSRDCQTSRNFIRLASASDFFTRD